MVGGNDHSINKSKKALNDFLNLGGDMLPPLRAPIKKENNCLRVTIQGLSKKLLKNNYIVGI